MIDFGPFQFAGAPRCATTWILHAVSAVGMGDFSKASVHIPHQPPKRGETEKLKASMVRHPYDWLASYYAATKLGHTGVPAVDRFQVLPFGSFKTFVEGYLREMPGAVGNIFSSYGANILLKVEDLPWCWMELLSMVGVSEARWRRCEGVTRQNWCQRLPKLDSRLKRAVMRSEREMVERYEYI